MSRPGPGPSGVLVVQHDPDAPPALLGEWAHERGLGLSVADVRALPVQADAQLVVLLGSEAAAYDDAVPWLAGELAWTRALLAEGRPVLGICFGAQLLARALGGSVGPAARPEVGWLRLETDDPRLVPPGPWLSWHRDAYALPPGATELARSAVCSQAFALGPALGVQFHPEVDATVIAGWAANDSDSAVAAGTTPEAVVADTQRLAPAARDAAFALFDAALARAAA